MIFPADLPWCVVYRMSRPYEPVRTRTALPRRPVAIERGRLNTAMVCPQIPFGATGWCLPRETQFRPLSAIPQHWMPFLHRQRGTEMDYRPVNGTPPDMED